MQSFAVIPAAGRSVRMGSPKLLLPWGSGTLFAHVLAQWRSSRVSRTVVVVHPDDLELAALAERAGAIVVRPQPPPPEMKDSIRAALAHVEREFHPAPSDCWLIAPADLPGISAAAIDAVLDRYLAACDISPRIVAAAQSGRRRHPVLFPWTLAAEVETLAASQGLDAIVGRHAVELVELGHLMQFDDLDTPAEYERGAPGGQRWAEGGRLIGAPRSNSIQGSSGRVHST